VQCMAVLLGGAASHDLEVDVLVPRQLRRCALQRASNSQTEYQSGCMTWYWLYVPIRLVCAVAAAGYQRRDVDGGRDS